MKKLLFIVFLQLWAVSAALAQELKPRFPLSQSDLTAQSQPRSDLNGRKCALVKIEFVGEISSVDGNVVGDVVLHTNETWVYMPQYSRQLKVITKNYLPLMVTFADHGIERLESGMTYVLTLTKPSVNTVTPTPSNTLSILVKDGVSIEMVEVEAGSFMVGATPEMKDPDDKEKPVHRVTLTNNYYLGKYEVTQAQWKAVMGSNRSWREGDNLPVDRANWDDCQEFISKLNTLTGKKFRLPTEAEWEFAARGGNKSRGYQYSGSNTIEDVAWYSENTEIMAHAVGTKRANELGLYDMSGNVAEWCQDWKGAYHSTSQKNPIGPRKGSLRIYRGGSVQHNAKGCRSSYRAAGAPYNSHWTTGLRLCLSE